MPTCAFPVVFSRVCFVVCALVLGFALAPGTDLRARTLSAAPGESTAPPAGRGAPGARPGRDEPWNVALYHGTYSKTTMGEIMLQADTAYRPSFIQVLALNRPLDKRFFGLDLEGEGQVVRHTGTQKHLEFNGVVLARLDAPFRRVPLTLAAGEGLSMATRNPDLENTRRGILNPFDRSEYSRKFLNYLVFEVELGLPAENYAGRPRAFLRVHHRSGIFGLMCPPTCGSNYVAYGMRFEM